MYLAKSLGKVLVDEPRGTAYRIVFSSEELACTDSEELCSRPLTEGEYLKEQTYATYAGLVLAKCLNTHPNAPSTTTVLRAALGP